ncbi:MAG: ECF-type sigma factor [Pirellula sp.]
MPRSYSYLRIDTLGGVRFLDLCFSQTLVRAMADDSKNSSSDHELLDRFRVGDQGAALELYYRYADRIFELARRNTSVNLASRFDPEDIVQSVFRTFFRRAASGQYEAPAGDELWKLLLVMALNKVRDKATFHRASKRDIRKTYSIGHVEPVSEDSQEIAKSILCMSVEEIIQKQPSSHQGIIRLRIRGMEVQDIASAEKRSKRTVERVLQAFRKQLLESALVTVGGELSS